MRPEDAHAPALIALFAVIELPIFFSSISTALGMRSRERRMDTQRAFGGALQQLVLIGLLAVTYLEGWWSADSIGIVWTSIAIPVGIAVDALYRWMTRVVLRRITPPDAYDPKKYVAGLARFWPRSRAGKIACVTTLALNGFTEELVTRGIFVHVVGRLAGSLAIGVLVGLAVNVVLHLYQGKQTLVQHAIFYLLTVLLLESPLGMLAAITLHVCADLAHADGRKTLAWVRAYRRASRRPVTASSSPGSASSA